jgi:hypothetical protein
MSRGRRRANLVGFVAIGGGLVAVGIATRNWGLLGAGVLFIIIGAADAVRARERDDDQEDDGT